MRILLWMIDAHLIPGGHRVQIEQTSRQLSALGVDVEVSFSATVDLSQYHLVHGFSLPPEHIRRCRMAGVPVVLSTIYWSRSYTMGEGTPFRLRQLCRRVRTALALAIGVLRGRHIGKCEDIVAGLTYLRSTFESADLLLPNSRAEEAAIRQDLGITTPCHVVPNAVDAMTFLGGDAADESSTGDEARDGVLYAGRFEPHKNQLEFIRAMSGSDLKTVLVGPPHRDHPGYYAACQSLAARSGGRIAIRPGVAHEDLPAFYRRAKVHALPSRFETTGLVSLEAALGGCNIVTTDQGYARDYFGDMAWYCNPYDRRSIRRAVEAAYAAPVREELRPHVLANFTWAHTAAETLKAYKHVLTARDNYSCGHTAEATASAYEIALIPG